MSAYVYLWDIFACVCVRAFHGILSLPFWLRSIKKVLKIYNWDLYFYLFLGMEEDAAADSPPHALASAGPISVAVGALCWWDMETWVTHYIYRSDPAVCHILSRLSFQVVFLGLQSCHVETFYQFHGGNFYFFFFFFLLYILILI
jgi:hypothetical protein